MKKTGYKKLHNIAKAVYKDFIQETYQPYLRGYGYIRGKPLCYCLRDVLLDNFNSKLENKFYEEFISLFLGEYDVYIGRGIQDDNEVKKIRETACLLIIEMTKP